MEPMPAHRRPKLSEAAGVDAGGGEDRLSALPDDVLIHIILKLRDAPVAGRTSVLARRWRHVWALLPELNFPVGTHPDRIRAALATHDAQALGHLSVVATEAAPASVAAWLPIAARRLSGVLHFQKRRNMDAGSTGRRGALKLPCFENATKVMLDLDSTGLTLPPSGIFTRLAELELVGIQMHGPCSLGDIVSSPRCPSLRRLLVCSVSGLNKFTIHSESLLQLELKRLPFLRQLDVVALVLEKLALSSCFTYNQSQPIADISAPQLVTLDWTSAYVPSSVRFGEMTHLQQLTTQYLVVYGHDSFSPRNRHCLTLLQHFDRISRLILILVYPVKCYGQFLMEEMTKSPNITMLKLNVMARGHSFGASVFHVLRMSSGIRELELELLDISTDMEVLVVCNSGCICDQPSNWKREELVLPCLEEVTINRLRGTEHELALVKRLFNWTSMLKGMTINFHDSITESKGEELRKLLLSFSRPGICMKFARRGEVYLCD